ncbi:MAG: FAD-dependent oxidoreductase [Saprospiraceae bacterium]
MYRLTFSSLITCLFLFTIACRSEAPKLSYDVLVLGEGTGAVAAAIQAARGGAQTLLVNPLPWLGGMLTSAGVSATDGNHQLPAGLWGEFRELIRGHYGGADSIFTGWVSNTMFEPHIGAKFWATLAMAEDKLTVQNGSTYTAVQFVQDHWEALITDADGNEKKVSAFILIDGTDLGDVAASQGVAYDLGMDAKTATGEDMAPPQANDIIQDFTYAAVLQDFGEGADKTIPRPADYDPSLFDCACQYHCDKETAHPCQTMLNYGKLPNNKYMINWPIKGNDYYHNMVELSPAERALVYQKAKEKTLAFVYYIQHELGFKQLGLAEDEFPTPDKLPLMPYHREGRRIKGLVRLNVNHIAKPYDFNLYRTGIAVGDYPIDHHHYEYPDAPEIAFPQVPSFNIPLGCLIPNTVDQLLVADKAISVTNIANGTTRLQPVVLQIGQAAGMVAALAAKQKKAPKDISIREVQDSLLSAGGYLMPFMDVLPADPAFKAIQRVGATGILKGQGIPYKWANQTWFYPDSTLSIAAFLQGLHSWKADIDLTLSKDQKHLTFGDFIAILSPIIERPTQELSTAIEQSFAPNTIKLDQPISKRQLAILLDKYLAPFHQKAINWNGDYLN